MAEEVLLIGGPLDGGTGMFTGTPILANREDGEVVVYRPLEVTVFSRLLTVCVVEGLLDRERDGLLFEHLVKAEVQEMSWRTRPENGRGTDG